MKFKYCLFLMLLLSFGINLNAEINFNMNEYSDITLDSEDAYQIKYTGDISSVTLVSSNESVATVSDTGLITPIADGFTLIYVEEATTDHKGHRVPVMVTKDGTIEKMLSDTLDLLTTIKVDFVKELMSYDFLVVNDDGYEWMFENYGLDFIQSYKYKPETPENVDFNYDCGETSCEVYTQYFVPYEFFEGCHYMQGPKSTTKTVQIEFANGNEEDKKFVNDFAKSLDTTYCSYINANPYEKFDMDKLIDNASFHSVFKQFGIDYELDIRKGDDSPESAMLGGHIVLGKNGVYYTVNQIDIYRTLKVPTKENMSLIEMITKYFEDYVLKSGEKVRVEHVSDNVYRAHVSNNGQVSFFSRIQNMVMPTLNAASEKTMTFVVEQVPSAFNPKTNDEINLYLLTTFISLFSLLTIVIIRKKYNN